MKYLNLAKYTKTSAFLCAPIVLLLPISGAWAKSSFPGAVASSCSNRGITISQPQCTYCHTDGTFTKQNAISRSEAMGLLCPQTVSQNMPGTITGANTTSQNSPVNDVPAMTSADTTATDNTQQKVTDNSTPVAGMTRDPQSPPSAATTSGSASGQQAAVTEKSAADKIKATIAARKKVKGQQLKLANTGDRHGRRHHEDKRMDKKHKKHGKHDNRHHDDD